MSEETAPLIPTSRICAACGTQIPPGYSWLCPSCYQELPGNERAELNEMARKRQPLADKVARCARVLRKRREKAARKVKAGSVEMGEP